MTNGKKEESNLFKLLLDLRGPDDERAPDRILHGLDARIDVVEGQGVIPLLLLLLLLLHLWIGSHADIATQNTTGERGVVTCSESCDEEMRESKVRNFYASE